MSIDDKKEELHASITAAVALERRVFEMQQAGASIDAIGAAIEQRAQFEHTIHRLNVEIAADTQAANLMHFLGQLSQIVREEFEKSAIIQEVRGQVADVKKAQSDIIRRLDQKRERLDGHEDRITVIEAWIKAHGDGEH